MTIVGQKFKYGLIERGLELSSNEPKFIYVDDVLEAFEIPRVNRFEANGLTVAYMRDDQGTMYQPKRIPCRPGCVIEVIYEPTRPDATAMCLVATSDSNASMTTLIEPVDALGIKDQQRDGAEPMNSTLTRRATTQLKSLKAVVAQANNSGHAFNPEGMKDLIGKHLVPANNTESTLQYLTQNVELLVQDVGELKQQGNLLEQLARKMIDMQQQALDRLSLVQSKTEAILTQQLEIAEYPIPRLFIVLPEEVKQYDAANWFRTKFRLHFICECGKHTETNQSKGHHLHLAKHEGYIIREPTKFFKKYGPFLLLMLEMIKLGTNIASHAVPALATLKVIELSDSVKQTMDTVTEKIDYSLECIDKQFSKFDSSSPGDLVDTDSPVAMTQQDLNNFLNNVEGLEGVELRQLGSFLKTSSKDNLLGNLYRMTTSEGYVKWVCLDHYRAGYQEKQVQKLREVVQQTRGEFDEQQGQITISLTSGLAAAEFYQALSKAKNVLELDVKLDWNFSKNDLDLLGKTLKNTRVSILQLDLQKFRPSFGSRLLPTSSQFETVFQLQDLFHMKGVTVVLSLPLVKTFTLTPRVQPRVCKLTCKLPSIEQIGKEELEILANAIRTNLPLTTLDLNSKSIGVVGAQTLSLALTTNSSIVSLNLQETSIGDVGAQALSDALKANVTMITLNLAHNSIGNLGVEALSKALIINSTLTTLTLSRNLIKEDGAMALSEALKLNSTLETLNLSGNSIGENGAMVLSEALKVNSTLSTLNLMGNAIGYYGARVLSQVLRGKSSDVGEKCYREDGSVTRVNTTLKSLNLAYNSIGKDGAHVLSEALRTNSTLIELSLSGNSLGDHGAQSISKAIGINSSLNNLQLGCNMIKDEGIRALSLALETNSNLTSFDLSENWIGEKGLQALSDVLRINSTLTTLNLMENEVGNSKELIQSLTHATSTCEIKINGTAE